MGRYYEAYVTDGGLARRLGEKVALTKKGSKSKERAFGKLVYYPDGFSLLCNERGPGDEELIPIKYGDLVGLRVGARTGAIWPDYVYQKG